jgi:uncharacterized coiled-coil protein SlyX
MVATTSHIFSGKVDIASNLQVGSSHLFVDTENDRVGITTASPDATLHVNGNVYATRFEGDGSLLTNIASNLEQITNNGNVTSNAVQFTNPDTGIITTGNVTIGNKLSVASLTPGSVPYIDGDNTLTDSHITQGTDKVSITSNLEITGNILMSGETYKIDSQSLEVKDRIVGIAYDNTLSGADTGILMEYPTKNIGLIHHGASGNPYAQEFTIGYTQNTATDTTILNDPANKITVNVLGDLHTQNNMTVDSGGSYFGDGTTLTGVALETDMTSNAARITNIESVNGTQTGLITGLRADMTSNASRMTTLETANTVQAGLITSIKSDVTSNTTRISTLEAANTVQAGLITVIETDVSDNAARITTLEAANTVQSGLITAIETDVTSNAARITTLEAANTVQAGLITAIEADVTDNAARITTLEAANTVQAGLITAIETDVTDNAARITTLEAANTVQAGLITAIETDVADNATRITNLDTDLSDNASRVSVLEATDAVYAGLLSGLRTDLDDTFITKTSDSTIISSNLEVTGNIFMRGDRFVIESETTLINDAIIGIANNNTVSTTDVGILMQRPTANVALVHHGGTDTFTIGYTQDTLEATDITNDTVNEINVNVLGQLHVQNNMTVGAGGSYYGDGSTLTGVALLSDATSNVTRIANLETANTVQAGLITTLTNDLSDNAARITTLVDANTVQAGLITAIETDVTSNATRISTLESANTVQAGLITTLTNDLSDNAGRITTLIDANTVQAGLITTLTNDLSDNAGRITTLVDANTVQAGLITTLTNDLSDNAARIAVLDTDMTSNATRVSDLEDANTVQMNLITAIEVDVASNAARVSELVTSNVDIWSNLASNVTRIAVLEAANTVQETLITGLRTDMTSNSGRIDALEPRVTNLEASNVDIWSNLALLTLDDVVNVNNATSNTVRFTNATTSLTASGNVTVSGNVTSTTALISNAATLGTTKEFVVTVSGGVFYIDGVQQLSLELHENQTYLFDLTNPGTSHPFRLATLADGGGAQNGSGSIPASDYTTGTDYTSVVNHLKFTVPAGAPSTLYYYCTIHSGMGGSMSVSPTAELIVSGRVVASGNVEASSFKGDGSQLTNIASNLQAITDNGNVTSNTVQFTNTGTSLVASGTVEAFSFVGSGAQLTDIASNLEQIVNNGNVTSNTILLTDATTGLVATGNVEALKFIGDGSELTNIASNLEQIANNGNVTSNTILLTDATTGLVATGNVHALKFIGDGSALSNLPTAGVWQQKGDGEIYYTASNVGISNADPGHNLSVGSNLYVDDDGSNVLVVTGNVKADYFSGDGSLLTNLPTGTGGVWEEKEDGEIYFIDSNVGISNADPGHNLSVGSNLYVDDDGSNVLVVTGNVKADYFSGDGSLLTNLPSGSGGVWRTNGDDEIYFIDSNVGISNADPGHNLSVGSNLYIDDDGSNVLVIDGNLAAESMTLGGIGIVPSYPLSSVTDTGNTTPHTIEFQNAETGLVVDSNIVVAGNVTAAFLYGDVSNVTGITANLHQIVENGNVTSNTVQFSNATTGLVTTANVEVGGDLTVTGNVSDLNVVSNVNMLHTSNTASIKLNSNVVMEFNRSKKLIKYPRVAMTANDNSGTNGYVADQTNYSGYPADGYAYKLFDNSSSAYQSGSVYSSGNPTASAPTTTASDGSTHQGVAITVDLVAKIRLDHAVITSHANYGRTPVDGTFLGSNNSSVWDVIQTFSGLYTSSDNQKHTINITNSSQKLAYRYIRFVITKIHTSSVFNGGGLVEFRELEYYGIPEYDPEADGVDVVVKSVPNVPNTDWLEVYYDAKDLADGATTVNDLKPVGTAINGTVAGNTNVTDGAFTFDGSGDYIVSGNTSLSGTPTITYSVWFKTNSINYSGSNSIVMIGYADNTKSIGFRIHSTGYYRFYVYGGGGGESQTTDIEATLGNWVHATITFNSGTGQELYLNGKHVRSTFSTTTVLSLAANSKVILGNYLNSSGALTGTASYDGSIANFRLFNRALTSDEIYQLYAYQKEYFGHGDLGMTLKAGRLGIGTSEPKAALDVRGDVLINGYQLTSMYPGFASGGDDIYDVDGYRNHVFTNSGTFTVPGKNIHADVLVVGGGGGGGQDNAGGGGAGGLIFKPGHTFAGRGASGGRDGYYVITIGSGGIGNKDQNSTVATAGNDTVIRPGRDPTGQSVSYDTDYPAAIFIAKGGGPGDESADIRPTSMDGGSGGGGQNSEGKGAPHTGGTQTQTAQSGDSGTYGYGNNGGTGVDDGGGGGGGAGAAGQDGDVLFDGAGGNGGNGLSAVNGYDFAEIFGTRYGEVVDEDVYFAGGGAGGNRNNIYSSYASGGRGGGGSSGGTPQTNENGLPGTGGGGAGSLWSTTGPNYQYNLYGGDGGSGIVIIRYRL